MIKEIDCWRCDEITCPYCGHEGTNSWDYHLGEIFSEVECEECGKIFLATAVADVTYTSKKKG